MHGLKNLLCVYRNHSILPWAWSSMFFSYDRGGQTGTIHGKVIFIGRPSAQKFHMGAQLRAEH